MRASALASAALLTGVALAVESDSSAPDRMGGDGFTLTITPALHPSVGVLEGEGLRLVAQAQRLAPSADVAKPFGVLDAQDKVAFMALLKACDARAIWRRLEG